MGLGTGKEPAAQMETVDQPKSHGLGTVLSCILLG